MLVIAETAMTPIPTPTSACTGDQNASLRSFRDQFAGLFAAAARIWPDRGFQTTTPATPKGE